MKIFRTQLVLIAVSVISFMVYFQSLSNPLKDTWSLGVIVFIPYFLIGVFMNYFTIKVLDKYNKKYRLANYLFPIVYVPFLFYFIENECFSNVFWVILGILAISNLIGCFFIKDE